MIELTILGLFFIYVGIIVSSIISVIFEKSTYKFNIEVTYFNRLCIAMTSTGLFLVFSIFVYLFTRSELLLFFIFGVYVNVLIQLTDKVSAGLEMFYFLRRDGCPFSLSTRSAITGNIFNDRFFDISITEVYYQNMVGEISRLIRPNFSHISLQALGNLSREDIFGFCSQENVPTSPYLTWDLIKEMNKPSGFNRPFASSR